MCPGITRTKHFVGIVVESDDDGEGEDKAYCPRCENFGVRSKLGPRVMNKGEVKPPDYDEWKQCHECGTLVPSYEAKNEGKLEGIVEPDDNPFDFGKPEIKGLNDKKKRYQKLERKQSRRKIDDEEVQKELDKGYELVKYVKTNPP